jgi:hydroxymethylpyrimidine/phosphomethylpyrimidine kinase
MVDVLFDGQQFTHISGPLVATNNVHGTGCTLSTAIACELAKGGTVPQVRHSQLFHHQIEEIMHTTVATFE